MHDNRGDTLVEVIVAFAVFALVAVSAVTLMNRGIAIAQDSLETSLVRQQIDAQADLLRYARDENTTVWKNDILGNLVVTPADRAWAVSSNCSNAPASAFVLRATPGPSPVVQRVDTSSSAGYVASDTYSFVEAGGQSHGLWIQATQAQTQAGSILAYDMHIRSCWYGLTDGETPRSQATIVRLYAN